MAETLAQHVQLIFFVHPYSQRYYTPNFLYGVVQNIRDLIEHIRDTLEKTPPELVAEIYQKGIILSGGGVNLKKLDKFLNVRLGVPVEHFNTFAATVVVTTDEGSIRMSASSAFPNPPSSF